MLDFVGCRCCSLDFSNILFTETKTESESAKCKQLHWDFVFNLFIFGYQYFFHLIHITYIRERGERERERIRFFFHFKVTESSKVFQRQVCISYVQNIHLKNSRYPFTTNMYLIRMLLRVDVYRYNNCY